VSIITVSGTVPLVITEGGSAYAIGKGFGPGATSYRRHTVDSPFVAGRFLVGAVPDAGTLVVPVIVRATTPAEQQDRMAAAVAAFTQWAYTVTYEHTGAGLASATYAWTCEPADYAVGAGGAFNDLGLLSYVQIITFTVPRSPLGTGPL
jgi:hypothetical protein